MQGRSAVVLLLLLSLHGLLCLALPTDEGSFHLQVSPPVVPDSAEERREHYRAMEAKDLLRHRQITMERHSAEGEGNGGRRQAWESSKVPDLMSNTSMFELPMRSAVNIAHVGMYIVSVRIGTPALPYNLVLDTANDLTWINYWLRRRMKQQSATTTTLSLDAPDQELVPVSAVGVVA